MTKLLLLLIVACGALFLNGQNPMATGFSGHDPEGVDTYVINAKAGVVGPEGGTVVSSVADAGADITASLSVFPNIAAGITRFNLVVRITELSQAGTQGEIRVVIPRDSHWFFAWDSGLTEVGGMAVHNAVWNYDGNDPVNHVFTTGAGITGGGVLPFGLRAVFDPQNSRGSSTITSQIVTGNGVDTNGGNNADSEKIDYFARATSGSTTLATGTFIDSRDRNVYDWVKIGEQVWMAGNLAYLPTVSGPLNGSLTEPFMYVYGYDGTDVNAAKGTSNYSTYGVLYNWPAALTACPAGWHLPSDAEWTTLTDYLINNGYGFEGSGDDIAKSMAATTNWNPSSDSGTPGNDPASNNSSGFSGLPGGYRRDNGSFFYVGYDGYWWSSTEYSTDYAWYRYLGYGNTSVTWGRNYKESGFFVRCLRDF